MARPTRAHGLRTGTLALIALAAAACTVPQTALVIRIDSDLRRGSELASVHVTVTPDGASPALDNEYDLTTTDLPLPGTVVLNAASPDDDRALAVTVTGTEATTGATIERDYTVHFTPERVVVLDVYLAARCAQPGGFACDPTALATCGPCDCDPIDPGALPAYSRAMTTTPACFGDDSGSEPDPVPDAAAVEAGTDSGADATPACVPTREVCNGVDDDCNGLVDDDLGYQMCGTGACRVTTPVCVQGAMGPCTPAAPQRERCNGIDDDCDGVIDDNSACGGTSARFCGHTADGAHPWLCCTTIAPGACPTGCLACATIASDPAHWACCNTPPQ